ncbi:MAG: HNH endonuclease [Microgenomates group bacterium]
MKWSENKFEILKLYSEGIPMYEIRKQYPLRYSHKIMNWLKEKTLVMKLKRNEGLSTKASVKTRENRIRSSKLSIYENEIRNLYQDGYSCSEIKDKLDLIVTVRSIQRYVGLLGILRTVQVAHRLALSRGRIDLSHLKKAIKAGEFRKSIGPATRYMVLKRDNFKCVDCGLGSKDGKLLSMDHIVRPEDGGGNSVDNLATRCQECNLGKYLVEDKSKQVQEKIR